MDFSKMQITNNEADLCIVSALHRYVFGVTPRGQAAKDVKKHCIKLFNSGYDPKRLLSQMIEKSSIFHDFVSEIECHKQVDLLTPDKLNSTQDMEDVILEVDTPMDRFSNLNRFLSPDREVDEKKDEKFIENLFECNSLQGFQIEKNNLLEEKDEVIRSLKKAISFMRNENEKRIKKMFEQEFEERRNKHMALMMLGGNVELPKEPKLKRKRFKY